MTPPKCRICGVREHGHRCRGGTAAQRIEERARQKLEDPAAAQTVLNTPLMEEQRRLGDGVTEGLSDEPPRPRRRWQDGEQQRVDDGLEAIRDEPGRRAAILTARRRWHTEEGDDGEARDVIDSRRKPARFYAPPGQCAFCDRRREAAKRTMRAVRERGEA